MILLLAFFNIITQLIKLWFFSSHLCVGLLFLCLYSLPSPPSPPELLLSLSTSLKLSHTMHTFHLTQLLLSHKSHNSSHTTHLTQLISHNSSHLTSHTTHLTQLISLNSSHTTQLTQELLSCGIWWSCFRVLALNFTQVLSHNSSHNSHNSSHTTPRIAQLISHKSTHSRAAFVWHLVELTELHRSSFTHLMMRLLCVCRHRNMNLINSPHPTGN